MAKTIPQPDHRSWILRTEFDRKPDNPDLVSAAVAQLAAIIGMDQLPAAIEALQPPSGVITPAAASQLQRNLAARERFEAEFPLLTSTQVADRFGSRAKNKAALAHDWRAAGRVFSIDRGGAQLYPSFQFDDLGRPIGSVAEIIALLAPHLSPWELALWFTADSTWFDGARAVDLLATDPDIVVAAAAALSAELAAAVPVRAGSVKSGRGKARRAPRNAPVRRSVRNDVRDDVDTTW